MKYRLLFFCIFLLSACGVTVPPDIVVLNTFFYGTGSNILDSPKSITMKLEEDGVVRLERVFTNQSNFPSSREIYQSARNKQIKVTIQSSVSAVPIQVYEFIVDEYTGINSYSISVDVATNGTFMAYCRTPTKICSPVP